MNRREERLENAGEPWDGEISLKVDTVKRPRAGLLALFGFLLLAFTAYGMGTSDANILDDVFELVRSGLFAALGWAYRDQQTPG